MYFEVNPLLALLQMRPVEIKDQGNAIHKEGISGERPCGITSGRCSRT